MNNTVFVQGQVCSESRYQIDVSFNGVPRKKINSKTVARWIHFFRSRAFLDQCLTILSPWKPSCLSIVSAMAYSYNQITAYLTKTETPALVEWRWHWFSVAGCSICNHRHVSTIARPFNWTIQNILENLAKNVPLLQDLKVLSKAQAPDVYGNHNLLIHPFRLLIRRDELPARLDCRVNLYRIGIADAMWTSNYNFTLGSLIGRN